MLKVSRNVFLRVLKTGEKLKKLKMLKTLKMLNVKSSVGD